MNKFCTPAVLKLTEPSGFVGVVPDVVLFDCTRTNNLFVNAPSPTTKVENNEPRNSRICLLEPI